MDDGVCVFVLVCVYVWASVCMCAGVSLSVEFFIWVSDVNISKMFKIFILENEIWKTYLYCSTRDVNRKTLNKYNLTDE